MRSLSRSPLGGESFQQFDLPICKWPNLSPANEDYADGNILPHQWRGECSASACNMLNGFVLGELCFKFCRNIVYVNRLPVDHGSPSG